MGNLVILVGSITVFFVLQAVYWTVVSKQSARHDALLDRLGMDDASGGGTLIRGGDNEGALAQGIGSMLEEAGEDPNAGPFFVRLALFFFLAFTLGLLVTSNIGLALVMGVVGLGLPFLLLIKKKASRIARIQQQLPEALEVMIISLRAGQSLEQTIKHTAAELDAPIGDEFHRIAEESALGRPLDEALLALSMRLPGARTVRTFVVSVLVLRQTGGNLIEVLESIIDSMRQQAQYERKLMAMTAEGRSSARMLAGLPPAFVLLAGAANEGYIGILFNDPLGQVMLGISSTLYVIGVVWTRRLTNPKT